MVGTIQIEDKYTPSGGTYGGVTTGGTNVGFIIRHLCGNIRVGKIDVEEISTIRSITLT